MRWITGFFGLLWNTARASHVPMVEGIRAGSAASGLIIFLFFIFVIFGVVGRLLGFSFNDMDGFLNSWMFWVAGWAFRILCGVIVAICAYCLVAALWLGMFAKRRRMKPLTNKQKRKGITIEEANGGSAGLGWAAIALLIGYFAWIAMVAPI